MKARLQRLLRRWERRQLQLSHTTTTPHWESVAVGIRDCIADIEHAIRLEDAAQRRAKKRGDFLDEVIAERTKADSSFPTKVVAAGKRRAKKRKAGGK